MDGVTDEASIASLFARKYRSLYTCVPYDSDEINSILAELEDQMSVDGVFGGWNHFFNHCDIEDAINKIKSHKQNGSYTGLSTDHFIHADVLCHFI